MERSINSQKPIQSPTSIKSYNALASQIQSERVQKQYVIQHVKWGQLRHKLKSMQLNKISVTSYLNQNKKNQGQRIDFSVRLGNEGVKNGQQIQNGKQGFIGDCDEGVNDPEKVDLFKAQMKNYVASSKLYSSKNKVKPVNKIKGFSPLTPYFSFAYQLQRNRPSTQQNSHKKPQQFEQKLFPKTPVFQSQSEAQTEEFDKRKRIGTSACSSNRGKNNKTQINVNNKSYRLKSTHSKILAKNNDLAEFSQLTSQDYHLRIIIRRRSNVVGDCIQAIQASIIRKKMLLFTAMVTSGQANYFADIKIKPPTDIFNDNCDPCKPISEFNTKLINHTSTGSHQMRLLLGPYQIMEYLHMFGFSSHPLQLQSSTRKLGIILVDFLSITDKGLRLDKNQLYVNFNNLNTEGKSSAVEQLQKLLKSNQLIRWKNIQSKKNKKRDNNHSKKTKSSRNNLSHHQIYEHCVQSNRGRQIQTDYYRIYGHPHPILNSKQYEKIQSYEKLQNQQQIENFMKDQPIEQSTQKNQIKIDKDKVKVKDKDKYKEIETKSNSNSKQIRDEDKGIEENLSKIQSVGENIQVDTISVGEDIKESKCMEVEEICQPASQ